MITRNFENLLATVLESSSVVYGHLPVIGVNGLEYFLTNNLNFPGSRTETFTLDKNAAGISLGTGVAAASKTDVNLANTITSGISVTISSKVVGCAVGAGEPYLEYTMTVTNTGSSAIVITEVGYKQTVKAAAWIGATSASDVVCLIDRTVLSSPVTIQAGDAGIVKYTLKTVPAPKTVSGVKIVNFTYGSDAEIAAMIDAARLGTIDLQSDGGWAVGDTRTIHLSAFTGGGDKAHAAQDIDIAISEFGDYMSCGCLFQFDFVEALATTQRMHSSNVNSYENSEMVTTTLPALVAALPSWLQSRLKTFSVAVGTGGGTSTVDTVTGNKLALRSEIEIFGATSYSPAGEGYQIEWYKAGGARVKRQGRTGSAYYWWERSPYASNSSFFCCVYNNGGADYYSASTAYGLAPFGCI